MWRLCNGNIIYLPMQWFQDQAEGDVPGSVIWLYFPWELDNISFLKNHYILMTEKESLTNCSEKNIPLEKVCLTKLWHPSINSLLHFFQIFWSLGKKNSVIKMKMKCCLPYLILKPWLLWFKDFVQYFVMVCFSYTKLTLNCCFSTKKISSYSICFHVETEKNFC